MKKNIPWPVKFTIKMLLGIAGVDYRVLKRIRIVEHGRMEDAEFATRVFNRHVVTPRCERNFVSTGVLLELGPGDSIATGVLGLAAGFSEVILVDVGCFADLRPEAINRLFVLLGNHSYKIKEGATTAEVLAQLRAQRIEYLTDGLNSLKCVAAGSIEHSFSNSVLQHVYKKDLQKLMKMLGILHAKGSFSSHSINFTDHFSGGFLNHRLPEWIMESTLIKRANLYTNRVSAQGFSCLFESVGFTAKKIVVDYFDHEHNNHVQFYSLADLRTGIGSRSVLRATFILQKD